MFVTVQKVLAAQGLRLRVEPEEAAHRMSAGMGGRRSMMGRKTAHKKIAAEPARNEAWGRDCNRGLRIPEPPH
jgi:hypothetical protein